MDRALMETEQVGPGGRPVKVRLPFEVPAPCGDHVLYRLFNTGGDLLYIGITGQPLRTRLVAHAWSKTWWPEVASCTAETHPDRAALAQAEWLALTEHRPPYNKRFTQPSQPEVRDRNGLTAEERIFFGAS